MKYLLYLGILAAIIEALKAAPEGEAVTVPRIGGVKIGKRRYTLNVTATPE